MSRAEPRGIAAPDPRRITTRREFGRELTLARRRSGLTVRQVATRVGLPTSTLGGYFAGSHLPALQPADLLVTLLAALGIDRAEDVRRWGEAYWRVREGATDAADFDDSKNSARLLVSTRPPVDRLAVEPRVRGRDTLVRALDDRVAAAAGCEQSTAVHVLQGLGGCGKSMVALTVAEHAQAAGIPVFWISGDSTETLAAGMHALTVQLGAAGYLSEGGSPPDTLWRCLDDLLDRWLLVLDNVDDPQRVLALPGARIGDGTGWLRPVEGGRGTVIVTTRDGDQAIWGIRCRRGCGCTGWAGCPRPTARGCWPSWPGTTMPRAGRSCPTGWAACHWRSCWWAGIWPKRAAFRADWARPHCRGPTESIGTPCGTVVIAPSCPSTAAATSVW